MFYNNSKNKIISTSNTSTFIVIYVYYYLPTINFDVFDVLIILFLLFSGDAWFKSRP